MKASGKIGSNGVQALDNVEKRFETDIHTYVNVEFSRKFVTCPTFEFTDQVARQQPLYAVPCSTTTQCDLA
jgi:hypothetical protein